MGVSICIASGKGGVGKSTIAASLGIALSKLGIKTIVVDGDVEGTSLGSLIGLDTSVPSLHDCLSGKIGMDDAIIDFGGGSFIVGGIQIEKLRDIDLKGIKKVIDELTKEYEVVLVDCPPGLGNDAVTVISSCATMLLVVTPDIMSIVNALKTVVVAKRVGCTIVGVLINKGGSEYDIPDTHISTVLGIDIIEKLKEDEEVKEALNLGKPIILHNPDSQFSLKIMEVAANLVGK
ncbi:MAG: P-loop NTPase [Candidatus Hydrothermarchaeales archaeon]